MVRIKDVDFDKLKSCVKDSNIDLVQKGYMLDFIDDCIAYQNSIALDSNTKKRHYTATLSSGKKYSFVLTFRHPMFLDENGYGKKVRRGLGRDVSLASVIKDDVNALLKDSYWHNFDKVSEARELFKEEAVRVFYNMGGN